MVITPGTALYYVGYQVTEFDIKIKMSRNNYFVWRSKIYKEIRKIKPYRLRVLRFNERFPVYICHRNMTAVVQVNGIINVIVDDFQEKIDEKYQYCTRSVNHKPMTDFPILQYPTITCGCSLMQRRNYCGNWDIQQHITIEA